MKSIKLKRHIWQRIPVIIVAGMILTFVPESMTASCATDAKGKATVSKGFGKKSNAGKKVSSGKKKTNSSSASGGNVGQKNRSAKSSTKKKSGKKSSGKKRTGNIQRQETSKEVKQRQEQAQKEIARTKADIEANEASVKAGLANLSKLEGDIEVSRNEMSVLKGQVNTLESKISTLERQIESGEVELKKLREEYLKAVKKMRVSKKKNSGLAFIFASKSFNEALRRMRYMGEFSDWKEKRSSQIASQVKVLREQHEKLAQSKKDRSVALSRQAETQKKLETQKQQQDLIVAELRANGDALRSHLARKQAEVNQLRNRVSQLIAMEEAKAAEEAQRREAEEKARIAREEQARKAREEQARLAREEEARQRAEEQRKQEVAQAEAKSDFKKTETKKTDTKKTEAKKTQIAKEDGKKMESSSTKGKDYASARQRKPRSKTETSSDKNIEKKRSDETVASTTKQSASKQSNAKSSSGTTSNFENLKGSLPHPVSGSFRITSRFGRQSLPDMPDVVYDNPGIDAAVEKGTTAQAVCAGTVAGVYMVPGFNNVVIIRHGDYYTVYGNISSPAVKSGDSVKQGQHLGKLATDPDNPSSGLIHFEVWKNRTKLDPSAWIR